MKKSLVLSILGLSAAAVTSYGQGQITLDTYLSSSSVVVKYLSSPVTAGLGLYVGLYYGPANVNAIGSVAPDLIGIADPMSLYSGFTLATGPGAVVNGWVGYTGQFWNSLFGGPQTSFQIAASGTPASYTLMLVVYNNLSGYNASSIRVHSTAFQMTAGNPTYAGSGDVGLGMDSYFGGPTAFGIYPVPEPTTLALAGLGGLSLWLMRRKKT